jgi:hypothetical protein
MKKKLIFILIFTAVSSGVVWGGYLLLRRYLQDREAAMGYEDHRMQALAPGQQRTTRTYSAKEPEEARKRGESPMGAQAVQTNAMNDAVQRNLRTLDEINRINQMNQRLMEQNQRQQRQQQQQRN